MTFRIIRPAARGGASKYVVEGWVSAIRAMGWDVCLWDGRYAQRVFDSFEPDLYIADVRFRHSVPRQVVAGQTRVAMTVDQWADKPAYPTLAANGYWTKRDHVRWVRKLDPCLLYHHTSAVGIDRGWVRWRVKEGRRVVSIPLAGDPIAFCDEGTDESLNCDIAFLGQYSNYKAPGLHEFLLAYSSMYATQIVGPGWPKGVATAAYLPDELRNRFFKGAAVVPCIHEPHARLYGVEITERLFKVPLSGGFTISDPVTCIYDESYFSMDEIPIAESGREMQRMVDHFIRHPEERIPFIVRSRQRILSEHTYFHRLATMLEEVGYTDRAIEVRAHITQALRSGSWRGRDTSTVLSAQ